MQYTTSLAADWDWADGQYVRPVNGAKEGPAFILNANYFPVKCQEELDRREYLALVFAEMLRIAKDNDVPIEYSSSSYVVWMNNNRHADSSGATEIKLSRQFQSGRIELGGCPEWIYAEAVDTISKRWE
jgi:hypothetical protein